MYCHNGYLFVYRWSLLHSMVERSDSPGKYSLQDFEGLQEVLAIASNRNTLTSSLATELSSLLPPCVSSVLQQWNSLILEDCSWVIYCLSNLLYQIVTKQYFCCRLLISKMQYPLKVSY